MNLLGRGLSAGCHEEDALSVREAELSAMRRLGAPEDDLLVVENNICLSYEKLGQIETSLRMRRDIYARKLKLHGTEHESSLLEAGNLAADLLNLEHIEEAKSLLRQTMPVARRVFGASNLIMLRARWLYARTLYLDASATLDDHREAVATLESVASSWTRIFGPAHPETPKVQGALEEARKTLAARAA